MCVCGGMASGGIKSSFNFYLDSPNNQSDLLVHKLYIHIYLYVHIYIYVHVILKA